jgi:hypothetical protein
VLACNVVGTNLFVQAARWLIRSIEDYLAGSGGRNAVLEEFDVVMRLQMVWLERTHCSFEVRAGLVGDGILMGVQPLQGIGSDSLKV